MKIHDNLIENYVFIICNTDSYTRTTRIKIYYIIYILSCNIII